MKRSGEKGKTEKIETNLALESYYRDRFWSPMLSYNQLDIYMSQRNGKDDSEPRMDMPKCDFDAISELTNYLSNRKIIGEYNLRALDPEAKRRKHNCEIHNNFIS